jgi:hypothetical protein
MRKAAAAVCFLTLLPPTQALAGQTLSGRVVEEGRDAPVPGALVALLDREGEQQVGVLADSVGRYRIRPPRDGEYVIQVTQLGYTTMRTPLLALTADGMAALDLELTPEALGIEGLEVEVEREARRELATLGLSPAELGTRWLDREAIEAIPGLPGLREALRLRGLPGVTLPDDPHALCLQFRRGTGCALVVLDGAPLPLDVALSLNLDEFGAMAILDPQEAMMFYGQRAAGGAVLLWSR